jgi:hypothetical protein
MPARVKASGEDDVCLVTNLPRYRCDHCTDTDAGARSRVTRTGTGTTIARYKGRCAYCDDPIQPGDPIRRVSNTMDRIHASHDLDA